MADTVDISTIITDLSDELLAEKTSETEAQKPIKMTDFERKNYRILQKEICNFKPDFSFDDAVNCWHKPRDLKLRTASKLITLPPPEGSIIGNSCWFYEFALLRSSEQIKQEFLRNGFYKRYFDFQMNWQQSKLYNDVFCDFFNQFVISGESNYGYYFHGNIGVGKTTLLTATAKILMMFLQSKFRYITMTRLVKIITSIDADDKQKISDLENCDILFIDDLAHEKYTTDNQEAVIRDFFAYRYGNNLLNIIAGNIDIRKKRELIHLIGRWQII